jgi:uncharacterized protein (DUF1778 family)
MPEDQNKVPINLRVKIDTANWVRQFASESNRNPGQVIDYLVDCAKERGTQIARQTMTLEEAQQTQ